ncbi:hypothetical protein [Scytonema sp. UIC 10036]|uniref:hypothetical protein n=1 Tax=Scytonema sp. UIC 10036 TaxID=2304196 RepID=UPI001A9BD21F|nr:hypothetical protein [Scytonema sp. UIC 10036]
MMALPQELQQSFEERLNHYEEKRKMPLLSNMELRGIKKGIEQGIERGAVQIARESVMTVLGLRLTEVSPELIDKLNNISDLSVLKQFLEAAVTVNSLAEFQQLLERITRPEAGN